ncbi:MAG: endoglucanase [Lachnospiraceae bacterium]|nr:endoglucanase [Lachnospiraceae bacterium]
MEKESYIYRNCPIPGGGYVTGFVFHEKNPSVKYVRTDIGGVYGYDVDNDSWYSLIDHVSMSDLSETYPIAIALDHQDPDYLYIACGVDNKPNGVFAVSHDRGLSFRYYTMPVYVHGNANGRGTGCRLIVDRNDPDILYFASQKDGLLISYDRGESWELLDAFPEKYMTFVGQSLDGKYLFAAGAGVTTAVSERLRGHSLYVSKDSGKTFEPMTGPIDSEIEGVAFAGHVAQRYSVSSKYLYVTYSVMGRNAYVRELGYSCDGGSVIGGRIYRYDMVNLVATDVTPAEECDQEMRPASGISTGLLEYGFSGISAGNTSKGLLIASTICRDDGDCIYRSFDYGNSWECVLHGLDTGRMDFRTSYMKPEYNGGRNLIHWLTDLKLDPIDEKKAWFNTGTGVFRTDDIMAYEVCFSDRCDGIEETVHLNVYAPPAGETVLIDIVGDLGGFAFSDIDKQCENSFADDKGNRYITCINADYSDEDPSTVIVTPRGNWTGETRGGLILSHDGCKTFERLSLPYGISDELDKALREIEKPNVNSGWVAISPDTEHIVWSIADGIKLPIGRVVVSHDGGQTFSHVSVKKASGEEIVSGCMKVFSDRTDSTKFYGFGDKSEFYISTDSGETYTQVETPEIFPETDFGMIDCANKTEIRGESGMSGIYYAALGDEGLWKITFDSENMKVHIYRLSEYGDKIYRVGLGLGGPGEDYINGPKALYLVGVLDGSYGFYRTLDEGGTYVRLNDNYQRFGDINSIEGDPRVYGRFYIATGSRGVLYGEPAGPE